MVYNDPTMCMCVCVCHFIPPKKTNKKTELLRSLSWQTFSFQHREACRGQHITWYYSCFVLCACVHVCSRCLAIHPSFHPFIHVSIHPLHRILGHLHNNILLLLLGDLSRTRWDTSSQYVLNLPWGFLLPKHTWKTSKARCLGGSWSDVWTALTGSFQPERAAALLLFPPDV